MFGPRTDKEKFLDDVRYGFHHEIQKALDNGFDINCWPEGTNGPLYYATDLGTMELLLQHKADVNHKGSSMYTKMDHALHEDSYKTCQLLLKYGAVLPKHANYDDKLYLECRYGFDHRGMQFWLECGADPNYEENGRKLIHIVRRVKQAKALVRYGADTLAKYEGRTAIELACRDKNHTLFKYLLKVTPNVKDIVNKEGQTLLHRVTSLKDKECIRDLLQKIMDESK